MFRALLPTLSAARGIGIGLGLLLITGSTMKFYAWNYPWPSGPAWYTNSLVRAAAIEWELILGLWMLVGWNQVAWWRAAGYTFSCLAIISLALGVMGQPSCGCFGAVRTSPWIALALDAVALCLLWRWRPKSPVGGHESVDRAGGTPSVGAAASGVALILAVLTAGTILFFGGSVDVALAFLRDEPLSISPAQIDFGEGVEGEILEASVDIGNWTAHEVRIVGGTVDCSCDATNDLPVVIPSRQRRTLRLRLHLPPAGGKRFGRFVDLWTDSTEQPFLRLPITCTIRLP